MNAPFARIFALAVTCVVASIGMAQAQTTPAPAPAAAAPNTLLGKEQLDQLVAPIALYSDTLLASVLMASTYPLEVVEASRWAEANKNLKGEQLKAAADKQAWDDSVKTLTATPAALSMMSSQLKWTQQLGDAVLAQQPDVMDAIQRMRAKAQAQNQLKTTKEQVVTVKQQQNKQVIVIEPADPNVIYVPYYNPAVVYGAWPYPAYPPYYFPPYPGYYAGAAIATGLAFGAGIAVGAWAANHNYWGGGMNWGGNNINVNRPVNINNINVKNWQHNAEHRHGVRYNNANVAQKFGKNTAIAGGDRRMDFRGRSGQEVLRPGGDGRPGGDRPGAGDRRPGGDRPSAGDRRPGGGDRPSARDSRPGGGGSGTQRQAGNRGHGGREALARHNDGAAARAHADRGRASMAQHVGGGGMRSVGGGGGGMRMGGGGGMRAGGGGGHRGGGGRGGGRRSDVSLKHDITLLGYLDNGLGFYRFSYNGSDKAYVGVMAQEVQEVMPDAVTRGRDGYLRVHYEKLGLKFQTYDQWIGSGARIPAGVRSH